MPEPELQWLWLLLMGFGTGVYGVLVGAGGGVILGPLLLLFFGKPPEVVAGTVLALVAVNGISGGFTFRRMGIVDKRSAYLFALAAMPGSVIAANAGRHRQRRDKKRCASRASTENPQTAVGRIDARTRTTMAMAPFDGLRHRSIWSTGRSWWRRYSWPPSSLILWETPRSRSRYCSRTGSS